MQCVILWRNTQPGRDARKNVGFIHTGEPDEIAVFDSPEAAEDAAKIIPILRAFPYQIVELADL